MPRFTLFRLAAVCALALSLTFAITAVASAKGLMADLRVVGSGGKVLAEKTVASANVSVKTSSKATCFGPGTGGSGDSVALKGNTAMGLLASGAKTIPALRPLSISDHFDFGLALCGIGGSVAKGSTSWYLKINHKSQQVGGEKAKIKAGDEVLWALATTEAPDYKYPEELVLSRAGLGRSRELVHGPRLGLRRKRQKDAAGRSEGDRRVGADRRRRPHHGDPEQAGEAERQGDGGHPPGQRGGLHRGQVP